MEGKGAHLNEKCGSLAGGLHENLAHNSRPSPSPQIVQCATDGCDISHKLIDRNQRAAGFTSVFLTDCHAAGKEGPAVSFPATAILKMPIRMPLEPDLTLSDGNATPSARLAAVHLPICTFDESFGEVVGKCKRAAD